MRTGARLLFVYGTLLRGEGAHHMLSTAHFVGEALTQPAYELFDLGAYPALVRGGATEVHGELYEAPAALLAELDAFEGHPTLFHRAHVRLVGHAHVHAYFLQPMQVAGSARIASGRWRARATAATRSA